MQLEVAATREQLVREFVPEDLGSLKGSWLCDSSEGGQLSGLSKDMSLEKVL